MREGYLPMPEVQAKIQEMSDKHKVTYAAWEKGKTEAADWEKKFHALEWLVEKDRTTTEGTIAEVEGRRTELEKTVVDHCRKILGEWSCSRQRCLSTRA